MRPTDDLLSEIGAFLDAQRLAGQRISETTFGRLTVNDGKLIERLRRGGSVSLETAEKIRQYMVTRSQAESAA